MEQPELGIKINEIRNQRSITQKELSESCNIDIRTIQRIESGDVTPRISTLKLIANALSCNMSIFNGDNQENSNYISYNSLLALFVLGITYFISWVLFSPIIPKNNFLLSANLFIGITYTITGVLFYYGFYNLGNFHKNKILKISSIIIMICIPLFLITLLISSKYGFAGHINKLIILLMGINSVIFGISLLKIKSQLMNLYKITGVLQILIAPFFIIPLSITRIIGFWFSIPYILLLLSIVYLEFKEVKNQNLSTEIV
ncbi:MAG TPA: helix-turn-helix transcriptional regulator [Draconibacterium sp.]|nr:helix-turn-helix transcriptional regulator [Draconibacterium sp.]